MQDIDLILFDWSGTISDDRLVVHEANKKMCEQYGIDWTADLQTWMNQTERGPQEYFQERGVTESWDAIWKLYCTCLEAVIAEGILPYMYNEVPEVLASLTKHGKKLAIVSSHPEKQVLAEAKAYGIFTYFDAIVGDVLDKTVSIRSLCSNQSILPQRAAYIGDMIQDVIAARAAAVYPIAVSHGYHSEAMLRTLAPLTIWPDLRPAIGVQ